MPRKTTKASLEKMKQQDKGYCLAFEDAVAYLDSRGAAIGSISRNFRLDPDELAQEGYEVLLMCVRDYKPVIEKEDGSEISVKFNTFFGSRLEARAMEMRNRDPEYQARQAMTDQMNPSEKERFRTDPPLLVQHLDHENTLQESLRGEVAEAYGNREDDAVFRIMRDSFFDQKLSELVAKESDEKKQAALLHVKVGGVYNFQEIAYHFGVTDSRASQVMNELMDAFYVQRLIDRDLKSVHNDFIKLKFNEKRVLRLLSEAFQNADEDRAKEIINTFKGDYKDLDALCKKNQSIKLSKKGQVGNKNNDKRDADLPPAYEKVFSEEENKKYPLAEVGVRPISSLKEMEFEFRSQESEESFIDFANNFDINSPQYPAVVSEDGYIIDGVRRIQAAKYRGKNDYLCITRKIASDEDKKRLRVVINMRLHSASKTEMYYAIGVLSDMGFSQQKISDYLGTSRTNVLVYCKVRDRAIPTLRGLFEDGLIQITNAATCADLPEEGQEKIVAFIRRNGIQWSKGKKFNKLYDAAVEGKVDTLGKPSVPAVDTKGGLVPQGQDVATQKRTEALQKQIETYAMVLKDQEIWAAQREAVINQQREELTDIKGEAEALRREVEAAELIKFGNPKAMEQELKQLRDFFTVSERLASAIKSIQHAGKDLARIDVRRKQVVELNSLFGELEKSMNTLRLEIHNSCRFLDGVSNSD